MRSSAIVGETNSSALAELAKRRLREKKPELGLALEGRVTEHHRFMLRMLWTHLGMIEGLIKRIEARIEERMRSFAEEIERLGSIPGVDRRVAEALIAETGGDMSRSPSAKHLASWAGMCPGNNESAGKRKSGKTNKGSQWLRRALVQAAWAASHCKGSYLSEQYRRLARRRGRKRALVAVGHTILLTTYHMLIDLCFG